MPGPHNISPDIQTKISDKHKRGKFEENRQIYRRRKKPVTRTQAESFEESLVLHFVLTTTQLGKVAV